MCYFKPSRIYSWRPTYETLGSCFLRIWGMATCGLLAYKQFTSSRRPDNISNNVDKTRTPAAIKLMAKVSNVATTLGATPRARHAKISL